MAGTGIYGELLKAQLENLASDPASTSVGRLYWNTTTQSARVYTSSGWDDLGSAGSSSGRNYLSDWFDSYKVESVGTSAATSTGNRTVAGNTDPTKWVTSDLTNLTFARSADTTLRQSYNYLINSGDANADFVETPLFTLDGVDLGKPITVSFDCAGVSASDDYQVCAVRYDSSGTYQEVIVIAGTASATTPFSARIPTGTTKFQGFFIAGSTATDQYAIRFMKHAVNVDLRIDSLYVGPERVVQGAGISDWVIFTPTINNDGSNSTRTNAARWRRVGDSMELQLYLPWTGAGAAATLSMVLPNSLTADSSKFSTANSTVGVTDWFDNGVGIKTGGTHLASTTTISFSLDGGTADMQGSVFASGDVLRATAIVPITGWSSNITMLDTANSEFVSNSSSTNTTDTTSFAYGVAGSLGLSSTPAGSSIYKVVRCQKPILPTTKFILEVSVDRTTWVEPGTYTGAMWIEKLRHDGTNVIGIGYRVDASSATDVQIVFGKYASGSTTAWTGTWYWRLRVVHGDSLAGTPISARNIVGDTTGTAVPAGYIGQIVTSSVTTAQNVGTSAQYFDMTSITLTPGTWLITGNANYIRNSATLSGVELDIGFSAVSGNSATGLAPCVNHSYELGHSTTFTYTQLNLPTIVLRYDGTTATMQNGGTLTPTNGVFYLKGYVGTYSAATPLYTCGVTAVRIA